MHRALYEHHVGPIPQGMEIDHENGIPLDNRLSNIRMATHMDNMCNTRLRHNSSSKLKGVSFNRPSGKFVSQIQIAGEKYHLGFHDTAEQAHQAYRDAALALHGRFARLS
jgi:hypothetical protein